MAMPKMWPSPIFEKHIFLDENAGNMPEKLVFGIFLRFHYLFFLIFCSKTCISNAQNMAESNFWEKIFSGRKCQKYAGKTSFLAFRRDLVIIFFWLFAERGVLAMHKTWPSPIFKKIFFRLKMQEICLRSPFLHIFFGLFPHISLFFHTKTLVISLFRLFVRLFIRTLIIR